MNQARKDTTGIKLEVNERFERFFLYYLEGCFTPVRIQVIKLFTIFILMMSVSDQSTVCATLLQV